MARRINPAEKWNPKITIKSNGYPTVIELFTANF
jgi:hypothetical protein